MSTIAKYLSGEKIENFIEKRKYLNAPLIYRILYDKYFRPDIYEKVINQTTNEIIEKTNFDPEFKSKLNNFQKSLNTTSEIEFLKKTKNFEELIVLSVYDKLWKDKLFIFTCAALSISNLVFLALVKRSHLEKKKFIFLDNNRIVFNKIVGVNLFFINVVKLNFFVFSGFSIYFLMLYIFKKNTLNLEEENILINNYKRSIILYSNLKF
jgi:hypothetical protein